MLNRLHTSRLRPYTMAASLAVAFVVATQPMAAASAATGSARASGRSQDRGDVLEPLQEVPAADLLSVAE